MLCSTVSVFQLLRPGESYSLSWNAHNSHTLREKWPYSELFWSAFPRIRTEYGEMRIIPPHSVRMPENADQNNSKYGHFSRSNKLQVILGPWWFQYNNISEWSFWSFYLSFIYIIKTLLLYITIIIIIIIIIVIIIVIIIIIIIIIIIKIISSFFSDKSLTEFLQRQHKFLWMFLKKTFFNDNRFAMFAEKGFF